MLSQYSDIQAVHIISHGSQGSITLGDASLNTDTLDAYSALLQSWEGSLSQDADILLYGCSVGEGDAGTAFIDHLADLTGADVAASDDATGSDAWNGDWDLEVSQGLIETEVAIDATGRETYQVTLADITVDTDSDIVNPADGLTSLREAVASVNDGDVIIFDTSSANWNDNTIDLTLGVLQINKDITINGDLNKDGSFDIKNDLTLNGSGASSVLQVNYGASAILNGMRITGGNAAYGGGIFNYKGTLTLSDSLITGNSATLYGGGIVNYKGTLNISDSEISGNTAGAGGGIFKPGGGGHRNGQHHFGEQCGRLAVRREFIILEHSP